MPILAPGLPKPDYIGTLQMLGEIPERLAAARSRLGISQATQAKQMGISTGTLSQYRPGSNPMQSTVVVALRWLAAHR